MIIPSKEGNNINDKTKYYNMIDKFHVMYMYKKIQAEAATTDMKTLSQLLKKFRKAVAERREEYYQEIGEKKSRKLRVKEPSSSWGMMSKKSFSQVKHNSV